ncbi:hypothetical protein L2E82_48458 [Cichorium intybus]|uniref:Uncharacterized protein n=1 Tax=Cichorium intybus TaxID=13427 RepID=A0ACB8YYF3_CICIN|nr:hypothetical protein L2E82_48458 [Cichorium intybus]
MQGNKLHPAGIAPLNHLTSIRKCLRLAGTIPYFKTLAGRPTHTKFQVCTSSIISTAPHEPYIYEASLTEFIYQKSLIF